MKNIVAILLSFLSLLSYSQEKHGEFKDYYENGKVKVSGQYNKGDKVGEWKDYYDTGELSRIYSFTEQGETTGLSESYYKNGQLSSKTEKLTEYQFLTRGYFEESGNLFYEYISIKKPKSKYLIKEGYYKEFTENNILEKASYYLSGELNGKAIKYYKTGEKQWEVFYVLGLKIGVYKQYYKNGQLKLEGNLEEGYKNGEEKRYNEKGNLIWKGSYDANKLHGKWVNLNELTGKKERTLKFNKGELKNTSLNIDLKPTLIPDWNIERVPIYPGCENQKSNRNLKKCMNTKIGRFVAQKFNTDLANSLGLSGRQRISVIFKINKSGEVTNIKARAPHKLLKQEAIRVISLLPKMIPGEQRGKKVIVPYALPIVFQVQDKMKNKKPSDFVRDY